MAVSRRSFVKAVGLGSAGLSTGFSFIAGHASEAEAAAAPVAGALAEATEVIRLSSNENNRGPGKKALDAAHSAISARAGRGYPPHHVNELGDAIAAKEGVDRSYIIVGTGSGPILEGGARAFLSPEKGLVSAAPSYATCEQMAKRMGAPVKLVPVDSKTLMLDLDGMVAASKGAGLLYICNPNNPTGLAHTGANVEKAVRAVKAASPSTAILIDEAYLHYVHDPSVKTVAHLAKEFPGVFVTRSFSKAHGMAGMRLGYAIGQPDTLKAITNVWQIGSMNTMTAAAGIASLNDTQHIAEEVAENARVREFTIKAFRDMGYSPLDSQTNCIFVDIKTDAKAFRDACAKAGIQTGRDFPPYEKTYSRISLGTMDEMKRATEVFRSILAGMKSTSAQ